MEIKRCEFTLEDVIQVLENPYINQLSPLEYGKAIQSAVEHYVSEKINLISGEKILVDVEKDEILKEKFNYANNGPGFDRLLLTKEKRVQLKFRQVDGSTPYSRQTHFENTRRHSEKNLGSSSKSGHVCYSTNEFDYVVVVLCHIKNMERTNYKNWSYSLIPIQDLEDPINKGFCLPHIPSNSLKEYACETIEELTKKFHLI